MPGTKAKSIGRFMDPGLAANQTVAALHRLQKLSRRSWGLGGVVQTRPRPKALPKSRRLGGKRSPAEGVATDPNFGGSTLSYRDGSTTTGCMPPRRWALASVRQSDARGLGNAKVQAERPMKNEGYVRGTVCSILGGS
jgi:hypothetical protein